MHKALFMFLGCLLTALVVANSYAAIAESNAKGEIGAFLPLLITLAITYWVFVKLLSNDTGAMYKFALCRRSYSGDRQRASTIEEAFPG